MSAAVIISEFRKNATESVRVTLDEYNGRPIVGVRVWFRPDDGAELRPGRAGIAMSVQHLPALAAGINAALAIAIERGDVTMEAGHER